MESVAKLCKRPAVYGSTDPTVTPFPMPLPFPEVLGDDRVNRKVIDSKHTFSRRRLGLDHSAKTWVNLQVGFYSFLALGCPRSPAEGRRCFGPLTKTQEEVRDRLLRHARCFCANSGGEIPTVGRGRARLKEMLAAASGAYGAHPGTREDLVTTARDVDLERVSLPTSAGGISPLSHLTAEQAAIFKDLRCIIKPDHEQPSETLKPCHRVRRSDEVAFVRKLLAHGMGKLMPEEAIPRGKDARPLVGGWFCVDHRKGRLRLIFDRRPQNDTEFELGWIELPSGPQMTRLILKPSETIRGSGDDLECWFYQLAHEPVWHDRNATGRRLRGADFSDYGGVAGEAYRFVLTVVGMGDLNGVAIAQATHEGILRQGGCRKESEVMRLSKALPSSHFREGAYVDDRLCTLQCPRSRLRCRPDHDPNCEFCKKDGGRMRDVVSNEKGLLAYKVAGAPRSVDKEFRYEQHFKAWGTEVDGAKGHVAAPLDTRRQLARLLSQAVLKSRVSKALMQSLLGGLVYPFQHAKHLMAHLALAYTWVETLPEEGLTTWNVDVRDELIGALLSLSIAFTDVRAPVSPEIAATDATMTQAGACKATVPGKLARALFRKTEARGESGRLDWSILEEELTPTLMARPSLETNVLGAALPWHSPYMEKFAKTEHINLQELKAVNMDIRRRVREGQRDVRTVGLIDSRVVVGAMAKGRSSSRQLNRLLRETMLHGIAFGVFVAPLWIGTEYNPADAPSRDRNLPARLPLPEWAAALWAPTPAADGRSTQRQDDDATSPHRWRAREYYAGAGGLTSALGKRDIEAEGFEAYPPQGYDRSMDLERDEVVRREVNDIENEKVDYSHFGITCSSWGILNNLNGGTRSIATPYGDGTVPREVRGNHQLKQMMRLVRALDGKKRFWSIENPRTSRLWHTKEMKKLMARSDVCVVTFAQCCYGLRPPEYDGTIDVRTRKETTLVTNVPTLAKLARMCTGGHKHVHAMGSVKVKGGRVSRAQAAGTYPPCLCRTWAALVEAHLSKQAQSQHV
jgi:hypothetical protein